MLLRRLANPSFLVALLAFTFSLGHNGFSEESKPQFEKSTLLVGDDVRKPIANHAFDGTLNQTGNYALSNKDGDVVIRNTETGAETSTPHEEDHEWALVKTHNEVAYFFGSPPEASRDKKPRLRRLDLKTSTWLDDFELKIEVEHRAEFVQAYADDDYFVVAIALMEEDDSLFSSAVKSFSLTCFEAGKSKAKWIQSFAAEKTRSKPGVYLWSSSNPDYADAGLHALSRYEDRLLLCPEGKQPLRCLNIDTGTELWSCERVWEYQRGFVGPSVWQHYIGRFRVNELFGLDEEDETELAKAKQAFNANFECSIIGGPAIVELKNSGDSWRGGHSIFVAVSKQPQIALSGYLGQCVIYELDDEGKVLSTTNLPRLVDGSRLRVDETGVTWKCQSDQLVRLEPSSGSRDLGAGPGGFDCQTQVSWLRTISAKDVRTYNWLTAGVACPSIRIVDQFTISVSSGGYVEKEGDTLYQFPIAITDLQSGIQKSLLVKVPFSNPIPAPETNYNKSEGQYNTRGSYRLAITGLSFSADRLQVVLASREAAQNLEFDLEKKDLFDLFDRVQEEQSKEEVALPEGLNLLKAAHDPNADRIRRLIANGADVDQRSKNGWSPLMSAACYGCFDTVELLIESGANVDFADNNCGGQTTLMWAARSGRSSKQKVKLLIEAGADIHKKTVGGSNLLMSAAGGGSVEIVELLLEKGMKPDAKNDNGYTALMSAAGDGSPKIIKLLVEAGAEVNAVDNKGKTALMFAADGYDEGETIKTLLELGADPNLKDSSGSIALDFCSNSNNAGAEKRTQILKKAMQADE